MTIIAISRALGRPLSKNFSVSKLVVVVGTLLLGAVVIYPISLVFKYGFISETGLPTLKPFITAFEQPGIVKAAINSGLLAIFVTAGSLAVGLPTAWLVARTDIRGKLALRFAATLSFAVPSFVTVIAWMFLVAPNTGVLNEVLRAT